MAELTFEEIDNSQLLPSPGSVMGFAGPSEKGPIGESVLLESVSDMLLKIGSEISTHDTIAAVRQALESGAKVRFSRSVHYTDTADPLTITSLPSTVTLLDALAADSIVITAREDGEWGDDTVVSVSVNADDANKRDITLTPNHFGLAPRTYRGLDLTNLPTTDPDYLIEAAVGATDVPAAGNFSLAGGDNGTGAMTEATQLGVALFSTGIYGLLDATGWFDFWIPGVTDDTQQVAAKDFAEANFKFYHASVPVGLTRDGMYDFRQKTGAYSGGTKLVSSYVCFHAGDLTYVDRSVGDNTTRKVYENSGGLAAVHGLNDTQRYSVDRQPGPHLSASGRNRATIKTGVLATSLNLAGNGNAGTRSLWRAAGLNWIEVDDGAIYFKGNRTAAPQDSKLQYANVRRLLLAIFDQLTPIANRWFDEPHDPQMWRLAAKQTNDLLATFGRKGSFQPGDTDPGYVVNCDQFARNFSEAVLNLPSYVDAGQFRMQIRVKPITMVEFINIEVVVDAVSVQYLEAA